MRHKVKVMKFSKLVVRVTWWLVFNFMWIGSLSFEFHSLLPRSNYLLSPLSLIPRGQPGNGSLGNESLEMGAWGMGAWGMGT